MASIPNNSAMRSSPPERRVRVVGLWRRLAAAALDGVLLVPVMTLLAVATAALGGRPVRSVHELGPGYLVELAVDGGAAGAAALVMAGIVGFLFFFIFHALRGQTPGQRLLGMRVVDGWGVRPSWPRALLRTAVCFLSLFGAGLGLLWAAFDREKRALHDWLAGTYVIATRFDSSTVGSSAMENGSIEHGAIEHSVTEPGDARDAEVVKP